MRSLLLIICISFHFLCQAQVAVNMASQQEYTYFENFADIANWTFNTTTSDGTFTSGVGAMSWRGVGVGGTGSIPNGTRTSHSTLFFQTVSGPGSSAGVYQQNQAMALIATGTTDNTSAVAMDLFIDFTGLNAGTLSFDWSSLNNSTGNRNASMRVYASVDGITFTEIPGTQVLNVTNNAPTSGSINFAALPSVFNNSSTARLRFYVYNGTGGTSGSRPKIQIDDVQVTAVPATVCISPTAQPSSLNLFPGFNTISGNFTPSSPSANGYLVIRSVNSSLSSLPVDGQPYSLGDNVGDGVVISNGSSTSFSANTLSPATPYYFFIFAMNHLCSGGPDYLITTPLIGSVLTTSGNDPCTAPALQPTNLQLSNMTSSSIRGSFTASSSVNADRYLVVRSENPTLSSNPVNGTQYYANSNLGGGVVVTKTPLTSFTANGLLAGTQYYFFVFAVNEDNCMNGPVYNSNSSLSASATTVAVPVCSTPVSQPTSLNLSATRNTVNGYFTPANGADGYLVVYSTSSMLSQLPQDGTNYSVGTLLGNGIVVSNTGATAFNVNGLTAGSTYYFYIFSKKDQCTGGVKYLAATSLQASITTSITDPLGYYFGNLHSHTSYSDGNKDNPTWTPIDAYNYAKNSMCMDFLGVSEHNHMEAGMNLSDWQPGLSQASTATTSSFLALYGMEWGVISNGGHVLVYGTDQLIGWETGNYNMFVPKSNYTGTPEITGTKGLFRTINDLAGNVFAMLAHPDNSDFNNIANLPLNITADSAIAGCAIESGPAFSTNTSYSDPASRLSTYWYFKKLLSRGYRLGPSIDHDNHNSNFGRTNYSRLAVISPSLSQNDFLQSVKQRRFYATHDCDTKVSFTLNNEVMGAEIAGTIAPAITVYAFDPTNPTAVPKIRLMYGIPGNGVEPIVLDSTTGNSFSYTDHNLAQGSTAYYYVEVINGGGYVITSPIWYTRNAVTPVAYVNFQAKATEDRQVKLTWTTTNEINNERFLIEHSADGVRFSVIDSVNGQNSLGINDYSALDTKPFKGLNFYRLRQVDRDGKWNYSKIVSVKLEFGDPILLTVSPNPAKDLIKLSISSFEDKRAEVLIFDNWGRQILSTSKNVLIGSDDFVLNIAQLNKGEYYVVFKTNAVRLVKKFIKL